MVNKDLIVLGNNIRAERNRLRYTQEKLAEITGLQTPHIVRIEKGEIDIRFSTLVSILKALNIPFDKIYDLNND